MTEKNKPESAADWLRSHRATGPAELYDIGGPPATQQDGGAAAGGADGERKRMATEKTLDHQPPDGLRAGPSEVSLATPGGSYVNKSQYQKWVAEWRESHKADAPVPAQDSPKPAAAPGEKRQRPPFLDRLRAAQTDETRARVDVSLSKAAAMARTLQMDDHHA